ncbi:unnamed protein product [Prunus armeniaca]
MPLLGIKILADFLRIDNLRPKLLISKQAIANLGEEYLPKLWPLQSEGGRSGWTCGLLSRNCTVVPVLLGQGSP